MSINLNNLTLDDFTNVCRTCLATGDMLPLYSTCSNEVCIVEMLMSCTLVQFSKDEGLPEQICKNCIHQIKEAYKFARNCELIDEKLRQITNLRKRKTEILNEDTKSVIKYRKQENPSINKRKTSETKDFIIKEEHQDTISDQYEKINNIKNEETIFKVNSIKSENFNNSINENNLKLYEELKSESNDNYDNSDENNYWSDDCPADLEEFSEKKAKTKRKRTIIKGPPFPCQICDISFETYAELQEHRKKVKHPAIRRTVTCTICQKLCASYSLKAHMRTHTKERPFVCTYCGRGFSLNRNLRRHIMIHTGERPYKCEICEKAFIQMTSLKEHMNKHSGQTPFVCSICGVTFKYNSLLRKHMRSKHAEDSAAQYDLFEHECPTCNRRYHTKQILKQHMLMHGDKTYLCSVCGKGFYNNAGLQTHIKVHTGVRPHACHVCGKAFRQTSGLKTHLLIHTGEKPYNCNICNKAFTQRNHLRYHMRTHTGEKPYQCSVCGKSFSTNGTLTVHKRTHTGETPYVCSICGRGFYDSSSMKKHKRGHGEQYT